MDNSYNAEIVSIVEACRCMGIDKITERRKSCESLQKLLANQSYIEIVDANSDACVGFTWNDIFKAACTYMKKVIDLLAAFFFAYQLFFVYTGSGKVPT